MFVHVPGASKQSLDAALDIALRFQAKLSIVSAIEGISRWRSFLTFDSKPLQEFETIAVHERQDAIADINQGRIPESDILVKVGSPLEIISDHARQAGADLIMKAGVPEETSEWKLMGGLAVQLIRYAPCNVLIWQNDHDSNMCRLLTAIDPSPDEADAATTHILKWADAFRHLCGATNSILNCWEFMGEKMLTGSRLNLSANEIFLLKEQIKSRHEQVTRRALKLAGIKLEHCQPLYKEGDPADLVPEMSEKLDVDLVIIGASSSNMISHLLIGRTSERIMKKLTRSLLIIRQ